MTRYFQQKFIRDEVTWTDYLMALLIAAFASGLVYGLEHLTVEKFSNISGFLILAVLISATLLGKGPAILTATACTFLYDLLMVPPFFGSANNADNLIKFSVFVIAALLTSWIAGMAKSYAIQLKKRERELMAVIHEKERYKKEKEQEAIKREAETLRNAILASVSHDLKTPLSSIIGAISSFKLCGTGLSESDKNHLINSVLSEANKLHGYLNNILEVARLEEIHTLIKQENLAADDVIDLTIKRLSQTLYHHRVDVQLDTPSLAFLGDERLMDIALGNILDNAAKFSDKGSVITIAAWPQYSRKKLVIDIKDEGVGIPQDETERVFDKFYRVSKTDQKNNGTGLGLWIARRIVEAHGGMIRMVSDKTTTGTCVRITLPLAQETVELQEAV